MGGLGGSEKSLWSLCSWISNDPDHSKTGKMVDLVYTVLYINANPVIRVLPVLG